MNFLYFNSIFLFIFSVEQIDHRQIRVVQIIDFVELLSQKQIDYRDVACSYELKAIILTEEKLYHEQNT